MFFSLSKSLDQRFPNHVNIGLWIFNFDNGWACTDENTWFKGYCHPDIEYGLWTKVKLDNDLIKLTHNKYRPYPLWWDEQQQTLTNLLGSGQSLWSDDLCVIDNNNLIVSKTNIIDPVDIKEQSLEKVCEQIQQSLLQKISALKRDYTNLEKKIFITGGIDTLTLLALCKKQHLDVAVIDYEYFQFDQFTNCNFSEIKQKHWAYSQIHHWTVPTMLMSGSCGDEFLFRGPVQISIWCAWHDVDLEKLLSNNQGYHVSYFCKEKNMLVFKDHFRRRHEIRAQFPTKKDLIWQLLNMNINDHQHWHLGHTMTWTPYLDLELTKAVLGLNFDDMIQHIVDAKLSRRILENLDPSLSKMLSTSKNVNSRINLTNAKL
jgi:hypothetical protein